MEQPGDNVVPGKEVAQHQNDANDNWSELASSDDDDSFSSSSDDEESVEVEEMESLSSSDDEESSLESEDDSSYDEDRFEFLLHEDDSSKSWEYEPVRRVDLLKIRDQLKKLVIHGIKELDHPTYTQLMDHFENNTGKIWDRIGSTYRLPFYNKDPSLIWNVRRRLL